MVAALDEQYSKTEMRYEKVSQSLSSENIQLRIIDNLNAEKFSEFMEKYKLNTLSKTDTQDIAKIAEETVNEFKKQQIKEKKKAEDLQSETGYDKLAESDGHYWVTLNRDSKFAYILGLLDGLLKGEYTCKSNLDEYWESSFKIFFHIKKLNDMVAALNIHYSDKIKRQNYISFILGLENQVAAGVLSSDGMKYILRNSQ